MDTLNYKFQDHQRRRKMQAQGFAKITFALTAMLLVGALVSMLTGNEMGGLMAATTGPLLVGGMTLREEFEPERRSGGGGPTTTNPLPEGEFQGKVLDTLGKQDSRIGKMTEDFDRLSKETKEEFEKLRSIREGWSGLDSDVQGALGQIKKLRMQLSLEARNAYGCPVQRLLSNEENKVRLFGAVAKACGLASKMPDSIKKAIGEDTSPGSTIIDDELSSEIFDVLSRYGSWSTLGVRRMGTKTSKYPISTARPVANFILTEGGTISDDTNKAGAQVSLEAEVIAVLLKVSEQLIQDAETDIVADVIDDFVQAVNYRLDFAAFQGDGTANATSGGVTGVFNFGTGVTAVTGNTTIATTEYTDWLKCLTGIADVVLMRSARWWEHPLITAASLGVKDSNGRPIFLTAQEAPALGALGSRFGFPITSVPAAPSTDSANQKISAFGDPEAFVVGVRRDIEIAQSEHFAFDTFQRTFRGIMRADAVGRRATGITVLSTAAS